MSFILPICNGYKFLNLNKCADELWKLWLLCISFYCFVSHAVMNLGRLSFVFRLLYCVPRTHERGVLSLQPHVFLLLFINVLKLALHKWMQSDYRYYYILLLLLLLFGANFKWIFRTFTAVEYTKKKKPNCVHSFSVWCFNLIECIFCLLWFCFRIISNPL